MDFTSAFVLKQYADMAKDNSESSDSDEEESGSEEEEDDELDDEQEKLNLVSTETQYINAMVAKIVLENEKNHPERSTKNVWEMLYGNMENLDATSSDEEMKKKEDEGSSSDASDDDSDSDADEEKQLTCKDIESGDGGEEGLLELKNILGDFLKDPHEQELKERGTKKKKNKTIIVKTDNTTEAEEIKDSIGKTHLQLPPHLEEAEEEQDEDEEEEEERYKRENAERIAKEKDEARQKWLALHSWMVEFRLKHNMTIMDFLEYTEADGDMRRSWQVKQLLSRTSYCFNPSESHSTWGGRTRKLLSEAKRDAESGEISHTKYIQLRLLQYRGQEYSPDDELQYTLRFGYVPPVEEEVTVTSNMFDDIESIVPLEPEGDEMNEQLENSRMAFEDENYLDKKYDPIYQDIVGMRSTFQYDSGSDISDSDFSYGDTDSSSGDEFLWVGGSEGHNMRKEQRKIAREDFNILNEIFDTAEEKRYKQEEKERKEREAKELAERCPTDIAGKIAWRLKKFEETKAVQDSENEAKRIEAELKEREERERRKRIRKSNKAKKEKVMTMMRALRPDTLLI